MTYKSLIAQDRFWIIPSEVGWDGQGYPQTTDVRCCMLDNLEELAQFEALWDTLKPPAEEMISD